MKNTVWLLLISIALVALGVLLKMNALTWQGEVSFMIAFVLGLWFVLAMIRKSKSRKK